tara:strand:- start:20720 stop:20935 length:216 start_codon:yes stop_codon:yes gene_type:complete
MAQKQLIARAGRGLLNVLKLVLRGLGALCGTVGAILFSAMAADVSSDNQQPSYEPREVDGDEAKSFGWNNW